MRGVSFFRRISRLAPILSRKCETHPVTKEQLAFAKTSHAFLRQGLLQSVSATKTRNVNHQFSNQVSFENQPQSWLFVNRAVAGAYGAQVNLELDLDARLSGASLEKLKSEVKLRGIPVDVDILVKNFRELRACEKSISNLSAERGRLSEEIKFLKEKGASGDVTLKIQMAKENLAKIKNELNGLKNLCDLECEVMLMALKLPNDLHSSTPVEDEVVIREVTGKIDPPGELSHVEIAKKFDIITFSNVGPKAYYLKRELALAEIALSEAASSYLASKHFRHMSGPEFFKTPIMEGCGRDIYNPNEVLTMLSTTKDVIEPMNHLAGVTLPTFVGYVAKTCIGNNILPFNMFSCGRCYQKGDLPGLFGAVQSTQATLFSCVQKENLDSHYHQTIDSVWSFLEPLGFPLRLLQVCARDLGREERRRVEFQVYAPSLRQFISVAHVSDLSDYVSRRVMVIHNQNHADIRSASLVHMISGSLVNVTSLLALWMEYSYTNQESFSLRPLDFNLTQSPSRASS